MVKWKANKYLHAVIILIGFRFIKSHPDIYHVRTRTKCHEIFKVTTCNSFVRNDLFVLLGIVSMILNVSREIQPYSCHDPSTKEEGVCMFSWNCQRSNGTHLTYCMDRFYFGSCCKLPPGVYIATPPPITSNEITAGQKYKKRPSTPSQSNSPSWATESFRAKTTDAIGKVTFQPSKTATSELPPGLVTWRPDADNSSASSPPKKSTSNVSYKPVLTGNPGKPSNFTQAKNPASASTIISVSTSTSVSKRRTRPTRPSGATNTKRRRPTKPTKNGTLTRPPHRRTRPTLSVPLVTRGTTVTVGELSTFFERSTESSSPAVLNDSKNAASTVVPFEKTYKPTKPSTHLPTTLRTVTSITTNRRRKPTTTFRPEDEVVTSRRNPTTTTRPITPPTTSAFTTRQPVTVSSYTNAHSASTTLRRRPTISFKPTELLTTSTTRRRRPTISLRPTDEPITSTTFRRRPIVTSRPTNAPSTSTTLRRTTSTLKPLPTIDSTTDKIKTTTRITESTILSTTKYADVSEKPTEESVNENTIEVVTFPPFPGITTDTTRWRPTTTTSLTRKTTLRPKPTQRLTTITVNIPTTNSATTTTEASTTAKISPNLDYTKVCGRPKPGPVGRVVGGGNSYFGEWPWVVSLRQWKKNAFLHKCGATLLNEFWAITAAHCVENVPLSDLLLRLGEWDINSEREPLPFVERRVQIVASHPQFDRRTFEFDLALLRFYEPVAFQRNVLPVCVPAGNDSYVGRHATVAGWGRLYEDGPLPDVIQEVTLPIITNKLCESMYRKAGFVEDIPDIFICAGYADGGKDSCEGDSGGPMVLQEDDGRWVLGGVISWGIGCALPNQPGVYTRITKFSEWINQIIIF